jgi:hypothetical protein
MLKQDIISRYEWARARFEAGWLTQQEWFEICKDVLVEIMEENKDVLIRLKDR